MKSIFTFLFCLLFVNLIAQNSGGGEFVFEKHNCLTDVDRVEIVETLKIETEKLKKEGKLPAASKKAIDLIWPVKAADELGWASFYGVSNFVDQVLGPGIRDFDCGTRSYDGHKGLDIFTWPFSWYLYENDLASVVAAAAGTIITKRDGHFDQNCEWQGAGQWNAVYVRHDDGSVAWYGHLKKYSLTQKAVGERVEQGEYIGVIASSGRSSGPHVHLELYEEQTYSTDFLVDAYQGGCNQLNTDSWWANQKPTREPTLNTIATHSQVPKQGCPASEEKPYFQNQFQGGDYIIFATYFHDEGVGHRTNHRIITPNGDILEEWSRNSNTSYNASWWYWRKRVPESIPGAWTFEVDYFNQTLKHTFYICQSSIDNDNDGYCEDVDCDDNNANIHPEAEDIPDNGIDENCDGIDVATTVTTIFDEKSVTVFPNPTTDFIQIFNSSESDLMVELYNSIGEKVKPSVNVLKKETTRFEVSDLSKGVYFQRFSRRGEIVLVKRVIVY